PARAGADDHEVDRVGMRVAGHPVEVLQTALVLVEQERRVVLLRHERGALDEARQSQSRPRSCVSFTGSSSKASFASQCSSSPSFWASSSSPRATVRHVSWSDGMSKYW